MSAAAFSDDRPFANIPSTLATCKMCAAEMPTATPHYPHTTHTTLILPPLHISTARIVVAMQVCDGTHLDTQIAAGGMPPSARSPSATSPET